MTKRERRRKLSKRSNIISLTISSHNSSYFMHNNKMCYISRKYGLLINKEAWRILAHRCFLGCWRIFCYYLLYLSHLIIMRCWRYDDDFDFLLNLTFFFPHSLLLVFFFRFSLDFGNKISHSSSYFLIQILNLLHN